MLEEPTCWKNSVKITGHNWCEMAWVPFDEFVLALCLHSPVWDSCLPPADSHHVPAEKGWLRKTQGLGGTGGCSSLCPVFRHSCGSLADIQDDEVVEAVSRDKKRELPLEQIRVLTEETFRSALLETARTVVLFYASCEYEVWSGVLSLSLHCSLCFPYYGNPVGKFKW